MFSQEFKRFIEFNQQKLYAFLLKSVTSNIVASFVLFRNEFPSIAFITPQVNMTKCEAAIF